MTFLRYQELLTACPELTAAERKRLEKERFVPRLTPIAAGARFAMSLFEYRAQLARRSR